MHIGETFNNSNLQKQSHTSIKYQDAQDNT